MSLANLIQKRENKDVATATVAIFAIPETKTGATVAKIARIAVANPEKQKTASLKEPILREHRNPLIAELTTSTTATFWRWRVDFIDHESMIVSFSPEASQAEVLAQYPDAVAAMPVPDTPADTGRANLLTPEQETAIRGWLGRVGETDPAAIAEVLAKCLHDSDARTYYLDRANPEPFDREAFEERAGIAEFDGGLPRGDAEVVAWNEDDRRRCAHCLNLLANGVCKVAGAGERVSARRGYQPNQSWLHRCPEYRPCPDDPDKRPGRERWPEFQS
jgi:hypothetical protein